MRTIKYLLPYLFLLPNSQWLLLFLAILFYSYSQVFSGEFYYPIILKVFQQSRLDEYQILLEFQASIESMQICTGFPICVLGYNIAECNYHLCYLNWLAIKTSFVWTISLYNLVLVFSDPFFTYVYIKQIHSWSIG